MSNTIKQLPELERPYEKFEWYGESALSNAELLAIIIKTGTKEETSVQLAQKILNLNETKTEGINFLRAISMQELMQIKGIGRVKAIQLKAVAELASRMTKPNNYKKIIIKQPSDLAEMMIEELRFKKQEIAKVVLLSSRNEVLKIKDIAIGSNNITTFSIQDILEEPVRMKAPKFILIHNHPSGEPSPSKQDLLFTKRLYEAAILLDIELVDHLIIGNQAYTSIFSEIVLQMKAEKRKQKERKGKK